MGRGNQFTGRPEKSTAWLKDAEDAPATLGLELGQGGGGIQAARSSTLSQGRLQDRQRAGRVGPVYCADEPKRTHGPGQISERHITANALTTIESLPEALHDLRKWFPFCRFGDHDQKVIGHGFAFVQRVSIESGECSLLSGARRINRKRVNLHPSELMLMVVI